LIKCTVNVFRNLYYIVIFFKQECEREHKLIFKLCITCMRKNR
jgi:hypothetical protein